MFSQGFASGELDSDAWDIRQFLVEEPSRSPLHNLFPKTWVCTGKDSELSTSPPLPRMRQLDLKVS
jgi:hypothetical protein